MVYGIRIYPDGLNKGFDSQFYERARVRHNTHEEGRRAYREYNNEDEDNSPNMLNSK